MENQTENLQNTVITPQERQEFDEFKRQKRVAEARAIINKLELSLSQVSVERASLRRALQDAEKLGVGGVCVTPYLVKPCSDFIGAMSPITIAASISGATAPSATKTATNRFVSPAVLAADERSARERYYAALREKAIASAEKNRAIADRIEGFTENEKQLSQMEIDLAKAEIFDASSLPALQVKKADMLKKRRMMLASVNLTEADLRPAFRCKNCSDTGFLKNGAACDCYTQK